MASPPAGDGFELVEKEDYEDPTWCTDDEYEFVEAPVEKRAASPAEAHAPKPFGGGILRAFPPAGRETIVGCDQGFRNKTIAQQPTSPQVAVAPARSSSPPPQVAVAPTRSSSPPQKAHAVEEKMKMASPYHVAAVRVEKPFGGGILRAFPPAGRENIVGCDQGFRIKTIAQQPTSPQGAVAPALSSPPRQQKAPAKEEKMKMASPYDVVAARNEKPPIGPRDELVRMRMRAVPDLYAGHGYTAVAAPAVWPSVAAHDCAADGEADENGEITDDDEDDYHLYESCYNLADYGRSRRVKPSSGRRGRTKKATTRGRPRGEVRSFHIAGNR